MKEKLNLTNLTKMTKKDLQATKGGLFCPCLCRCADPYDRLAEANIQLVYEK